MTSAELRWHCYPTARAVTSAVVSRLAELATRAIAARGAFRLVLSGGSTPREIYAAATGLDTQWRCWHIYFADERCLPRGHLERSDTMAREVWLSRVPIPTEQIHPIPAELGPAGGAAAYRDVLASVGRFDLVLLGLGEDGHTASLFPGDPTGAGPDSPDALAVRGAPKPPPERVTLSAARLARARSVYLVVLGPGKRGAVGGLRAGADLPVGAVRPPAGLDVYLDSAANAGPPGG